MPKAPPKPCLKASCSKYATVKGYCDEHQTDRKSKQWNHGGKSRHDRGYGWRWVKLRERVLSRDGHLCQECLNQGIYKQGNQVDHIKPKSQGGSDEMSNLQVLCVKHHNEKTLKEAHNG